MENTPATQASTIEDRLDLLVQQGGGHDRALELLVDILAERGRHLLDDRREDCIDLIMAVAPVVPVSQYRQRDAGGSRPLDQAPRSLIPDPRSTGHRYRSRPAGGARGAMPALTGSRTGSPG